MFRKEISIFYFEIYLLQLIFARCAGCLAETVTSHYSAYDVIPTNSAFRPEEVLTSGAYESDLRVVTCLPFEGTVGLESEFPSTRNGIVNYICGNSPTETTNANFIPVRNSVKISAPINTITSDLNNPSVLHVVEQVVEPKASGKVHSGLLNIIPADTLKYAGIFPGFRYRENKEPDDGSANARIAASKKAFSGVREGNIIMDGKLGVAGKTAIIGQLPVSGAVKFQGAIPVYGTVTLSGSSSYVYH